MNVTATVLLVVAGMSAIVDWWSVAKNRHDVEVVAKPLTMVLLIAVALVLDPLTPSVRAWFLVGLVMSVAGDVFLMLKRDMFVAGLGSFLSAHIAYMVGLALAGVEVLAAMIGLSAAFIAVTGLGRQIRKSAAKSDPRLSVPVGGYIVVISAMLVTAAGTTNLVALSGATLFYASDAILGWNRFVSPIRNGRLLTMMSYHGGQLLLVLALITL